MKRRGRPTKNNIKINALINLSNNISDVSEEEIVNPPEIIKQEPIMPIVEQKNNMEQMCCWWDTYEIIGKRYELIMNYIYDKKSYEGYFCSLNCMYAYSNAISDNNKLLREVILKNEYNIDQLVPSESRYCLSKYGGDTTIEEYRKNFIMP